MFNCRTSGLQYTDGRSIGTIARGVNETEGINEYEVGQHEWYASVQDVYLLQQTDTFFIYF